MLTPGFQTRGLDDKVKISTPEGSYYCFPFKFIFVFVILLLGSFKLAAAEPLRVVWSMEPDSVGRHYVQTMCVTGSTKNVKRLMFNQFARKMRPLDPADTIIELVPGYYAIESSRFAGADSLEIQIRTRGSLRSIMYAPDGFHAEMADGSVAPVERLIDSAALVGRRSEAEIVGRHSVTDTPEAAPCPIGVYDIVPSFKNVSCGSGSSLVDLDNIIFAEANSDMTPEDYRIEVGQGKMTVTAHRRQWPRLRLRLANAFGTGLRELPDASIVDGPSLPWRGLMIDVARNFQSAGEIERILTLMATYGLNVFHFHLCDDEGWRLEIPSLPELVEVGGRRGYGPGMDSLFLPQFFAGDGNPASPTSNNGYYTRRRFIELLRHADSLGIAVLPEIESPGHARAAIRAMELHARRTGDSSWLLREPNDSARYTSAQSFHDNVMNPALPGPYKFMSAVADDIADMYREAGVALPGIHIGGDEVPRGSYERELADFIRRVASDLAAKGIAVAGWQEIALGHDSAYNEVVGPRTLAVNCWRTMDSHGSGTVVDAVVAAGYPVVLSNADHFYFDMCYSHGPFERGLTWAGTTDEYSALSGYPSQLCSVPGANILGVQGQVWSETIRNAAHLEEMLFPKMLGLAERAWNPAPTYGEGEFHALILNEIPKWQRAGVSYHAPTPPKAR